MKAKLVEIQWQDADGEAGWSAYDSSAILPIIKTFGLLVDKNDKQVVHADSYCHESKMWSGLGRIPRNMVKRIRVLQTVEI